jgi:NhaA family Na+:H+ antiporter
LKVITDRLREDLGDRVAFVYRHFPNERSHPGARKIAAAVEAAGKQGKFWEMHDAVFDHALPLTDELIDETAAQLSLDMAKFDHDANDPQTIHHVDQDLADGKASGVSATPTIFVDALRYDGPWDFYSMLEAVEQPVGARVGRTARAFANLPSSAGLVLLMAAVAGLDLRKHWTGALLRALSRRSVRHRVQGGGPLHERRGLVLGGPAGDFLPHHRA